MTDNLIGNALKELYHRKVNGNPATTLEVLREHMERAIKWGVDDLVWPDKQSSRRLYTVGAMRSKSGKIYWYSGRLQD